MGSKEYIKPKVQRERKKKIYGDKNVLHLYFQGFKWSRKKIKQKNEHVLQKKDIAQIISK